MVDSNPLPTDAGENSLTANVNEMTQVRTAGYRPPMGYKPSFLQTGLPPFTLRSVEWMKRDPQLKLGMAIKTAPYHKVKLTMKGDPEVVQFMGDNIRRFWLKAIPKITNAFWYTLSGGEIVCRNNLEEYPEFYSYQDVYPSDMFILTKNRIPVGISVKLNSDGIGDINSVIGNDPVSLKAPQGSNKAYLFFPKGFLYLHKREFNSLQGCSDFEPCYDPWLEKNDWQGAKHSRKLWFYKNAFNGGIMFHPPGDYITPSGDKIPYETIARQAMETSGNGAVWCIAQKYDDKGNPMWNLVEPKVNPGGSELINYVQQLDIELLRGLGIPDDVVQQVNTSGGSFSGRTIPLMSFFISQESTLDNLFTVCDEQVFRPLCKARFGHDKYDALMDVDIDRLMGVMSAGDVGSPNAAQDPNSASQGFQQDQAGQPSQMSFVASNGNKNKQKMWGTGFSAHTIDSFNGRPNGDCRVIQITDMRGTVYMSRLDAQRWDAVQMSDKPEKPPTEITLHKVESGIQEIKHGKATAFLQKHNAYDHKTDTTNPVYSLASLRVPTKYRGKGHAHNMMKHINSWADENKIKLHTLSSPLDKKTKIDKLVGFYKKHGFNPTGKSGNGVGHPYMERGPAESKQMSDNSSEKNNISETAPHYAEKDEGVRYQHPQGYIEVQHKTKWSPRKQSVVGFVVDKEHRGKGTGDTLLKHAISKHDDIGGQVSSLASLKVFHNNGFRNPDLGDKDFEHHTKQFKEDGGSLYMAHKDDDGKHYVKPKQLSQIHEPAGEIHKNRSGKESHGGQFVDNRNDILHPDHKKNLGS